MNSGINKGSKSQCLNHDNHMSIINEENLRAIIRNMQVGLVLIDAETHEIVDLNAKAEEMIGCERDKILGNECHEFICPAKHGQCPITDLGQDIDNAEKILITWRGEKIPILKTVKRMDIDGHSYILDSFVDLTAHKATQDALRESETKYRLLSDNSTDVIWTLDINTRKFTFFSSSVQKLRGYTPEEAMTIPMDRMMTPESLKNTMNEMKKGLDEEKIPGIDPDRVHILQLEELCKDGSTIFVEAKVKFLRDGNGRPTGVIGSSRDVTERRKAEEALQKSETKYRLLVDTANEAIIVSQDGMLKFFNRTTAELLEGYSEQEIATTPFPAFIHPDDREMVVENYRHRMKGEEVQDRYEFRVITRAGAAKWVEISAVMIEWEGKPATLNFLSDITKRRKAEKSLQESEARYRTLLEASFDLIYVIGRDDTVQYVNPAALQSLRKTSADVLGKPRDSLFPPAIASSQKEGLDRIFKTGEPLFKEQELQFQGIVHWQETQLIPIKTPQGDVDAVMGISRDITERKETSEKLRKSEYYLRALIESMGEGVMVIGTDYKILDVNKATIDTFGFTKEEMVGRYCYEVSHKRDSPCEEPGDPCPLKCAVATGKSCKMIHLHSTTSGEPRYIELNASPIPDEHGEITRIIEVSRDVTERKKTDEVLKESEEKFRTMMANSADAVFIADKNGNYLYTNPKATEMLGYSAEEFTKMNITDISKKEDIEEHLNRFQRLLQTGELFTEITFVKKNGFAVPTELNAVVMKNNQIYGSCRDITARKKIETAMKMTLHDLERYKKATIDREMKMVELKEEMRSLKEKQRGG